MCLRYGFSKDIGAARRSRSNLIHCVRPALERLDVRIVPSSMRTLGNDLFGIAGGGTVWRDLGGSAWSQLGTLTGAVEVQPVFGPVANGSSEQLFAQQANGSVSVNLTASGSLSWQATGGGLYPGTMIADANGVAGIAGGGTVFHYDTASGWSRYGTITNVIALAEQEGGGRLGGSPAPAAFAERSDDTIWQYSSSTKQWTSLNAALVPGTMIGTPIGVAGIAGGGSVWEYTASSRTWSQVGTKTGFLSLACWDDFDGILLGVQPDASVWSEALVTGSNSNAQWANSEYSSSPRRSTPRARSSGWAAAGPSGRTI